MLLPLYVVAAITNIIAKANNFNIDFEHHPDFDIRVKRYIPKEDLSRDVNVNYVNKIEDKYTGYDGHAYSNKDAEPFEVNINSIYNKNKQENNKVTGVLNNNNIPSGYDELDDNFVHSKYINVNKHFNGIFQKGPNVNELLDSNEINFDEVSNNNYDLPELENSKVKVRHRRSYYLPIPDASDDDYGSGGKRNKSKKRGYYPLSDSTIQGNNDAHDVYNFGQGTVYPYPNNNNKGIIAENNTKGNSSPNNTELISDPVSNNKTNTTDDSIPSKDHTIDQYSDYDNGGFYIETKPKTVNIYGPKPNTDTRPKTGHDTKSNRTNQTKTTPTGLDRKENGQDSKIKNNNTSDEVKNEQSTEIINHRSKPKVRRFKRSYFTPRPHVKYIQTYAPVSFLQPDFDDLNNDVKDEISTGDKLKTSLKEESGVYKNDYHGDLQNTAIKSIVRRDVDYENGGYYIVKPKPKPPKTTKKPMRKNKKDYTGNNNKKNRGSTQRNNKPSSTPRSTTKKDPNNRRKPGPGKSPTKSRETHRNRWRHWGRSKRSYYLPIPDNEGSRTDLTKPNRQGYYLLSHTYIPGYNDGQDVYNFEGGKVYPYPKKNNGLKPTPPPTTDADPAPKNVSRNPPPTNKNKPKNKHYRQPQDRWNSDNDTSSTIKQMNPSKNAAGQGKIRSHSVISLSKPIEKKLSEEDDSVESSESHRGRWHSVKRFKRSYYLPVPDEDSHTDPTGKRRKPNRQGYYPLSHSDIPGYNDEQDVYNFEGGNVYPYPKKNNGLKPTPPPSTDADPDPKNIGRNPTPTNKNNPKNKNYMQSQDRWNNDDETSSTINQMNPAKNTASKDKTRPHLVTPFTKHIEKTSSEEDDSVESSESHRGRWHSVKRFRRSYYLPVPDDNPTGKRRKPNSQGYYPLSHSDIPGYNDGQDVYNYEGGTVYPYPNYNIGRDRSPPTSDTSPVYDDNAGYDEGGKNNLKPNRHKPKENPDLRNSADDNSGILSGAWTAVKNFFGFNRKKRSVEGLHDNVAVAVNAPNNETKRNSVLNFFNDIIEKVQTYTMGEQVVIINENNMFNKYQNSDNNHEITTYLPVTGAQNDVIDLKNNGDEYLDYNGNRNYIGNNNDKLQQNTHMNYIMPASDGSEDNSVYKYNQNKNLIVTSINNNKHPNLEEIDTGMTAAELTEPRTELDAVTMHSSITATCFMCGWYGCPQFYVKKGFICIPMKN